MGILPQSFKRLPDYDTPRRWGKDVVLLALTKQRKGGNLWGGEKKKFNLTLTPIFLM